MIWVEIHETKNRKREKISETKHCSLEKNNKIDKYLARLSKKRKRHKLIIGMKQKYLISLQILQTSKEQQENTTHINLTT